MVRYTEQLDMTFIVTGSLNSRPTIYLLLYKILFTLNPESTNHYYSNVFFYFSKKINFAILCKLSAWQMIHMNCHNIFSLKNKKKHFKS